MQSLSKVQALRDRVQEVIIVFIYFFLIRNCKHINYSMFTSWNYLKITQIIELYYLQYCY